MKNWKQATLTISASVNDAVKTLEQEALGIVLITDQNQHLIGTVTDGDIRRGLIRQISLDASVSEVMSSHPVVARKDYSSAKIRELMRNNNVLHIPVVDEAGRLVGLELINHVQSYKNKNGNVFLMAGGFGTRLRPLTDSCPKPLLKVGNKPILEIILESFINNGFSNFYISTHYMPEKIIQHFGDGSNWDVSIKYIHEQTPLGTAGALALLPEEAKNSPLILMNGDLLTNVSFSDLLDFHNESKGVATMCVREYQHQIPYGVITPEGNRIASIVEKPVQTLFVNAGIYVLSPDLIRKVQPNQVIDMPDLLQHEIFSQNEVSLFPVHEYWLDIGRIDDFERAQRDISLFN